MALIRHAEAERIARDAIVLDLGDVQAQAARLMEQARRRAEEIVRDAEAERRRIIAGADTQGHAEGHARGQEEGRRAGAEQAKTLALGEWRTRLEQLDKRWTETLQGLEAARDQMLAEARTDVLRLALLAAEKIVKRHIEANPGVVGDQIEAVLALVARPSELVLMVHPDDVATAEAALPTLLARFRTVRHAELVTEASLTRGSCVARTRGAESGSAGGGEIDASIGTQMARVAEMLLPDDGGAA